MTKYIFLKSIKIFGDLKLISYLCKQKTTTYYMITIQFIERNFDKFNSEYFNNELVKPAFEIMHTKSLLGQCKWDRRNGKRVNYRIRISDFFVRTEKDYQNTILHEMIHLFIRQKDIKDTRAHHGKVFYEYADFINQYGWNIARTDSVSGCEISDKETVTYYLVAFKDSRDKYFLMRYDPTRKGGYLKKFAKYSYHYKMPVWFTSTDNRKYASFTKCRTGVRGRFITEQEYLSLKERYAVREAV